MTIVTEHLIRRLSRLSRASFLLTLGLAAGCAHVREGDEKNNATVHVLNRGQFDITILLNRGSRRQRLGLVPAASERRFTVTDEFDSGVGAVTLVADPVGSDRVYHSPRFRFVGGDEVFWTLMPNLEQSSLMVGN